MKALRALEKEGYFTLPKSNYSRGKTSPRPPKEPVPDTKGVPNDVGKIGKLTVVLVESKEQMHIWNELMVKDHSRGAGLFVGCQLYYLISSEYCILGGFLTDKEGQETIKDKDVEIMDVSRHQPKKVPSLKRRECIKKSGKMIP